MVSELVCRLQRERHQQRAIDQPHRVSGKGEAVVQTKLRKQRVGVAAKFDLTAAASNGDTARCAGVERERGEGRRSGRAALEVGACRGDRYVVAGRVACPGWVTPPLRGYTPLPPRFSTRAPVQKLQKLCRSCAVERTRWCESIAHLRLSRRLLLPSLGFCNFV